MYLKQRHSPLCGGGREAVLQAEQMLGAHTEPDAAPRAMCGLEGGFQKATNKLTNMDHLHQEGSESCLRFLTTLTARDVEQFWSNSEAERWVLRHTAGLRERGTN